jgi:hypothetical protein
MTPEVAAKKEIREGLKSLAKTYVFAPVQTGYRSR